MNGHGLSGNVQTVLGPIDPDSLGATITHEHLVVDLGCYSIEPAEASLKSDVVAPVRIDTLTRIRQNFRYNLDNRRLWDVDAAIEEVSLYKYAGGDAIVDASSVGLGRDPIALARISRATGLNIIMGASYYVPFSHPQDMDQKSEDEIAIEIIRDVNEGVGDTGIGSGIIGEVGVWWPHTDNVKKVLRASAHAQNVTGASILIHPGYNDESHHEIMDILIAAEADPTRVIVGHLDHTLNDFGSLKALADRGCFMEYDNFGSENTTLTSLGGQYNVTDAQRLDRIEFLIEQGHLDKILLSHDVCTKSKTASYGGVGYAHILNTVVPRMKRRGFTEEQVKAMLVDNPRRALTIK